MTAAWVDRIWIKSIIECMDRTQALKILHLPADASFGDVKKSYRILARKYHPDLSSFKNRHTGASDSKMKQINLAYCFLASVPEPEESSEQSSADVFKTCAAHNKTRSWLLRFRQGFLNFFHSLVLSDRTVQGPECAQKNRAGKPACAVSDQSFDRILRNAGHKPYRPDHSGKSSEKHAVHAGYRRYVILKNQMALMKSARYRISDGDRIDPVQPVSCVQPLRYD